MKRLICLVSALLLLATLMGGVAVSAAGTATITASKNSVTVGQQVTVTAKYDGGGKGIGSLDAYFRYNAKTFEYVSCDGATANGGAWMAQYAANKLNGLNANAAASPLLTANGLSRDNDSTWRSSQYAQQFFLPYLQNQLELMKAQQQYYQNGGYYGTGTGTGANGDGTVSGVFNWDNVSSATGGMPGTDGQGNPAGSEQKKGFSIANTDAGKGFLNGGF